MTTSASTVEEINQLFRLRYSGRAYDPTREVSSADINALFEAARWSPSGGNYQPWRYVYADKTANPDGYARLLGLLSDHNREWAHYAPVLLVSAALMVRVNAAGETSPSTTALHDLGLANMSIALEAVHRGLMTHMIGGFNKEAARELFPDNTQPAVMMTVGYPGDPSLLSEHNRMREGAPRTRKLIDEFVQKA